MAILNYTTTVSTESSVMEIQKILSSKGATKIMLEYEEGQVSSLRFAIMHMDMELQFLLPANWRGVLNALNNSKIAVKYKSSTQARKVCWRIIKDWVEAQMAIIEAEQASIAQVFLPYAVMQDGGTVSDNLLNGAGKNLLMINSGK